MYNIVAFEYIFDIHCFIPSFAKLTYLGLFLKDYLTRIKTLIFYAIKFLYKEKLFIWSEAI